MVLWFLEQYMTDDKPLTISVPEAGRRYFGLSRNASYMAAARGELPTVRMGRLLCVPVRALEKMLDEAIHSRTTTEHAQNRYAGARNE